MNNNQEHDVAIPAFGEASASEEVHDARLPIATPAAAAQARLRDAGALPPRANCASAGSPLVQFYASYFAQQFNAGLEQMLSGLQSAVGVPIGRLDVFALHHEVFAAPALFGLSNASAPCIRLNTTVAPYCERPGEYLFWDGTHPTVAGHGVIAQRANAVISVMWPR